MPKKEEKRLLRKIEKEYRNKGFSLAHSKHIANAVVYGNPKVRAHFKNYKHNVKLHRKLRSRLI